MMRVLIALSLLSLAACGADGAPLTPKYSLSQTVGFNSTTGTFQKTVIGVEFGG